MTRSLLGVVLIAAVGVFPLSASAEATCAEAQKQVKAWVDAQGANLPTRLKDFGQHSMPYRKAIFVALSAEQKSALWQEHIRAYMDAHPKLTAGQQDALKAAMALLTPEFYRGTGNDSAVADVQAAITERFGAAEAAVILATLGAVDAQEDAPSVAPFCQCSTESVYCGNYYCNTGGCLTASSGCGFGWGYKCNGLCGPRLDGKN